ncbi:hypothetical protein M9Y10_036178 [Tritrichomonas musculus]|uniref:Uncharacterized protein n=1 Tax=Tritrichomonas musculus TaxID=1915356 RepID=A0ABR2GVG2_9EUKA
MTTKPPEKPLSLQEEYENEKAQNDQLQKQSDKQKKQLTQSDSKYNALKKLVDSLQAAKKKLMDQLRAMREEEEKREKEIQEDYENSLTEYRKSLESSKIPLQLEKSQYEMINNRYKFILERWEIKRNQLNNSISEKQYTKQLVASKIRETNERINYYKKILKSRDPNLNLDEDPNEGALKAVYAQQLRIQQEAREKQEQKEELEKKCRELKEQRDALKKKIANSE